MFLKKYSCFIFLFAATFFFSCKKEDPHSEGGTPIFYAKGTMNGNFFNVSAGVNNYYMYSSYSSDVLDIYQFEGNLKEKNCSSSCPKSMTVRIRDYRDHTTQATSIDSALIPGFYNFSLPPPSTTLAFTSQVYADSISDYTWDFGDSNTSNLPNPVHTYATAGIYYVCLTVNAIHNTMTSSSSICDTVYAGVPTVINPAFTTTPLGPDSVQFDASVNGGTAPYVYFWRFGDGFTGNTQSFIHQYVNPGIYSVELYVTDANFVTEHITKNVTRPSTDSCYANFTYQPQSTTTLPELSKIIIEWTDASGFVFTSADSQQPTSSTFEIVSVENFDDNENHQLTKKVHMRVNCVLFNGLSTLLLENVEIVFAVAYHQ